MGWEKRGKNEYYYQKIRRGDKVFSKYIGNKPQALALASAIRHKASLRNEIDALCDFSRDLSDRISLMMKATFIAGELCCHRGEWRRKKK